MMKKFEVTFSAHTPLSPCVVYVYPSEDFPGHYFAGILYTAGTPGNLQSAAGIAKSFDLRQHITSSEREALSWATEWLSKKSGSSASLGEVAA